MHDEEPVNSDDRGLTTPPDAPPSDPPSEGVAAPTPRIDPPSVVAEKEARSQRVIMRVVRLMFLVLLVAVTLLTVTSTVGRDFGFAELISALLVATAVGVLVLLLDAMTPNKRLSSVVGVYLGICVGLIGALAIGALVDVVAQAWELDDPGGGVALYLGLGKVLVAITLCYLAVSVVLTTKDDFRLVIPYVEFSKQMRGVRPLLVDTSALIDGRIESLAQTGFIDAPLVVPQFVIEELQTLGDSADKLKRARGRRGLGLVSKLQANPYVDVTIDAADAPGHSVDHKLLNLAAQQNLRILTTDYALNKVAEIHGVNVLNLNDAANVLKSQAIPGETLVIEVAKRGEGPGQGVGYLADGTMVVVEEAAEHVGEEISLVVTNSLQTSAGRMIFGRVEGDDDHHGHGGHGGPGDPQDPDARVAEQMGKSATSQPRAVSRPPRRRPADSPRNPRR